MRYRLGAATTVAALWLLSFNGIAMGAVDVSPTTIDFGIKAGSLFGNGSYPPDWVPIVGGTYDETIDQRTVTLTNTGPGPITVLGVDATRVSLGPLCGNAFGPGSFLCAAEPPSFECSGAPVYYSLPSPFPLIVLPGETCHFTVFYIAQGLGPLDATFRILTDAPTSPHVVPITALRNTTLFVADTVTTGQAAEVSIEFPGCVMTAADWLPEPGIAGSVSSTGLSPEQQFPYGVFRFEARPCAASDTRTVSILFPSAVPAGARYMAYGPTPTSSVPHWFEIPMVVTGRTVTFEVTDNGPGDGDPASGTLVSHSALAIAAIPATAIPTLSRPMLIALAIAMIAIVAMNLGACARRR